MTTRKLEVRTLKVQKKELLEQLKISNAGWKRTLEPVHGHGDTYFIAAPRVPGTKMRRGHRPSLKQQVLMLKDLLLMVNAKREAIEAEIAKVKAAEPQKEEENA